MECVAALEARSRLIISFVRSFVRFEQALFELNLHIDLYSYHWSQLVCISRITVLRVKLTSRADWVTKCNEWDLQKIGLFEAAE